MSETVQNLHPTSTIILVAEDNLVSQKMMLVMLRTLGYQAEAVVNGHEAIIAAATGRYALILMDYMMPEMDGFEATISIRQQESIHGTHVPIIAVTVNVQTVDRKAALTAGLDDYLPKPVSIQELRTMVERWLRFRHQTAT